MYYDHSLISGFYCKHHKRYTGKREPRVACIACWWLYFAARGDHWTQGVPGLLSVRVDSTLADSREVVRRVRRDTTVVG